MGTHEGSSSGGSSSIDDDGCKIQVNAYAKVDARLPEKHRGCTPVMVSITGPSSADTETRQQRAPIDVVLVLHVNVRCKTPAEWHHLLNQATKHLVDRLGKDDRLAIVPALLKETRIIFEDAVVVPVKPKLLPMSDENKAAACNSVESSEAMRSNTQLVRDLQSAEEILFGRESNVKEKRAGHIIVISNSDEDMSSMLRWRFRSIHAFGFCDAGNARTMYTIATSRESTCGPLDDVGGNGSISPVFIETINKITSATVPVEVRLKCKQEVVLSAILAPRVNYFISHNKKVGIIWFRANAHRAAAGSPVISNCIFYLDIPQFPDGGAYHESQYGDLLDIQVKYGGLVKRLERSRFVTVREGMCGSTELVAEMVRVEAVKIITDIAADARNGRKDPQEAAGELRARWIQLVQESGAEAANTTQLSELAAEVLEMQERLRDNSFWLEYMLSWRSHQWWPLPSLKQAGLRDRGKRWIIEGVNNSTIIRNTPEATTASILRLKILAKIDTVPAPIQKPELDLPVLVHFTVPLLELEEEKRRLPLDLVAVLDVGCGGNKKMMEKKLKVLNKAMGFIMKRLSHKDRLAIIPVRSTGTQPAAAAVARLLHKNSAEREYTRIQSILTSGSNTARAAQQTKHWDWEHLKKTMCLPIPTVGNSHTTAVSGSTTLLSNSLNAAVKLLDSRRVYDNARMGLIILVSDSDDIPIRQTTFSANNYTIHAFSFRGAGNARAMYRIASSSSGIYASVNDKHDEITEAFITCIREATSIIAVNTKVNIECNNVSRIRLSAIESTTQFKSSIDSSRKSGTIFAGAIYPGAERRFIAYLRNVRDDYDQGSCYLSLPKMLAVSVTWQHGPNMVSEKLEGQVVVVSGKTSKDVVEEIIRIQETKIASAIAIDPMTETESVLGKVQELCSAVAAEDDDNVVAPSLVNDEVFDCPSLPNMLSWLSFQGLCERPPSTNE